MVNLEVNENWDSIFSSNPEGTTYLLKSGVHREKKIVLKKFDVLIGEPGAILNGARLLNNWTRWQNYWSHIADMPNHLMQGASGAITTDTIYSQSLFCDDIKIKRVFSLSELSQNEKRWLFDESSNRILINFNPDMKLLEVMGKNTQAIITNTNATVKNLTIEKYPNLHQNGAVSLGNDSLIELCEIRWCHTIGVNLTNGSKCKKCWLHHLGLMGFTAHDDTLVEECEINDNSWAGFVKDYTSGGGKFVSKNAIFKNNYVHRNYGPGVWFDIDSKNILVEGNIIENNDWEGVLVEISSEATIKNNVIKNNGSKLYRGGYWGGQICLQNSMLVTARLNYIEISSQESQGHGIVCINQTGRGGSANIPVYHVRNCLFENNVIVSRLGTANGVTYGLAGYNSVEELALGNIVWRQNHYIFGDPSNMHWLWKEGIHNYDKWFNLFQQDQGSIREILPVDQVRSSSPRLLALKQQTTGFNYFAKKESLTWSRSVLDRDNDTLPDWWEIEKFNNLTATATDDSDQDGVTNLDEFRKNINPRSKDTDNDMLDDGWEINKNRPPHQHSSAFDLDSDGFNDFEEFLEGTDPNVWDRKFNNLKDCRPTFLLRADRNLSLDSSNVLLEVKENSSKKRGLAISQSPKISVDARNIKSIDTTNGTLTCEVNGELEAKDGSFSLIIVLAGNAESPWNVAAGSFFSMETYAKSGLRCAIRDNFHRIWSIESGGNKYWSLSSWYKSTPHILTIIVDRGKYAHARIFVDGVEHQKSSGVVVKSGSKLITIGFISGAGRMPCRFYEVSVYDKALSPSQRLSAEQRIKERILGEPFMARADTDFDGVSDGDEISRDMDVDLHDSSLDVDNDGLSWLEEITLGTDGRKVDTDDDGMDDKWESSNGTNPTVEDAHMDIDMDGVTNLEEYFDQTSPNSVSTNLIQLPFDRLKIALRKNVDQITRPDGSIQTWSNIAGTFWNLTGVAGGTFKDNSGFVSLGDGGLSLSASDQVLIEGNNDFTIFTIAKTTSLVDSDFLQLKNGSNKAGIRLENNKWRLYGEGDLSSLSLNSREIPLNTPQALAFGRKNEQWFLHHGNDSISYVSASNVHNFNEIIIGSSSGTNSCAFSDIFVWSGHLFNWQRKVVLEALVAASGTNNQYSNDTDVDGLPDWWEILGGGTFVGANDAQADSDGDGVNNLSEYLAGSVPVRWKDGDKDGMLDAWEIRYGLNTSDPNDALLDSDNDGCTNWLEFLFGNDPLVASFFDPILFLPSEQPNKFKLGIKSYLVLWNKELRIESSNSLKVLEWEPEKLNFDGAVGINGFQYPVEFINLEEQSNRFYRLKIKK